MTGPIKKLIPDTSVLQQKLDSVLESSLPDFLSSTNTRREEMIGNRRFAALAFFFAIAIIISLYLVRLNYDSWMFKGFIALALGWLTVVIISGRSWLTNDRLLAKEMNMALVPILTNVLGRMLMYTHDSEHRDETRQFLTQSELMTMDNIEVVSDDMYTIYGDREVSVRELHISQKVMGENGVHNKKEKNTELFKGVFVVVSLNRSYNAETYISTDNDRVGFGHRTFWSDLLENGDVKETVLEWNDFEENLHVASSDPAAAREILTPEFMQHLNEWWLEHKLNIRISFKGDKMFILLPESSIQIGTSTTSTKSVAISKYALSLVRPMWRSLMLVEDVPRQG